ncbi:hypothetical protein Tco_0978608, partial [Tanacetum coccineum]
MRLIRGAVRKYLWTPPMLAIAAAGNDAADDDEAANEDNAAAGSAAAAHPVPHSPLVSPVRELTPERQSASERPPSLSPTPQFRPLRPYGALVFGTLNPDQLGVTCGPLKLIHQQQMLLVGQSDPTLLSVYLQRFGPVRGDRLKQLRTARLVGDAPATEGDVDIQDDVDLEGLSRMASEALGHDQPAVPSEDIEEREEEAVPLWAPMPELVILLNLLLGGCSSKESFRRRTASERLVQSYGAVDLALKEASYADLRYRLIMGKPMQQSDVNQMMRVDRDTSQPSDVPAASTHHADDPDSAVGGSFNPAGLATPMTGSAVPDTAGDSAISSSLSPVLLITYQLLFCETTPTPGGIHAFFLDSDEDEQIGLSRVAAEPDSDDEVLAEILFRGQYVSGAGVVVVDKLPDDEIVDPRVKVEPISESPSSPPRSRSKHRGVRSDTSLWDRPVDDFLSSESESDDDIEEYIPPIPYGAFKDWEIVRCPLRNTYYHVYYQENRRHRNFFYLKELLPHVYREDLLLLRRRMNRYFRLNPDVDVGLDLWRDVNLLCQSLHSDDVEDFWRTQDEWVVSGWRLYPKSSVHVLDLTNGKTVYMFVDKFYPIRAPLL